MACPASDEPEPRWQNRYAIFCRELNHGLQIILRARKHNTERLELINGRIRAV